MDGAEEDGLGTTVCEKGRIEVVGPVTATSETGSEAAKEDCRTQERIMICAVCGKPAPLGSGLARFRDELLARFHLVGCSGPRLAVVLQILTWRNRGNRDMFWVSLSAHTPGEVSPV
jgi:hypothetical protein